MSEQLGVFFLVLVILAASVCLYLSITMSRRVQMGINRWRNEEKGALETQLKQLADADARLQIERWKQEHEQEIRLDAVQRSSAITRGKVTEHIVPYLPGFDLDPKGIRFLGTPIDLIAFRGLNASVEDILGQRRPTRAASSASIGCAGPSISTSHGDSQDSRMEGIGWERGGGRRRQ